MDVQPEVVMIRTPKAPWPLTILLFAAATLSWAQDRPEPRKLDDETRAESVKWLKRSATEPTDYVVSKFAAYDLVLLGETHEVKENCEFVAALVGPMYKAGVRTLCSEFLRSRFNDRLAEIVSAADYEEAAVVDLFRRGPWPTWGYREYLDIVRAVWAFNRKLPAKAESFRIVGIDADWKQVDLLKQSPAERFKIVTGREEHMAGVIEREVFGKKAKALMHIGFAHTVRQGNRLAAKLAREHGERMFQVCLHHEMPGRGGAARFTGFVEEAVARAEKKAVGFDVAGTPLAGLRDDEGQYFRMLGPNSKFQDFAQGYVFLKPARELTSVSWVKGFIVPDTFAEAKELAERLGWVENGKHTTAAELDAALAARRTRLWR
jgi:hypothetical protein